MRSKKEMLLAEGVRLSGEKIMPSCVIKAEELEQVLADVTC